MKNIRINNLFSLLAIIIFVVGSCFVYMVAEIDDAPGFAIFGMTGTTFATFLIYGLGKLIELQRENNGILKDIENKMRKKN